MTPIEIEQIVKNLKNKFDNLEKTVNKEVDEKLKELTEEVHKLKVEVEILKQGGNL